MLEDDFVWFAGDCHGKRKKSSKMMAGIWCSTCGMKLDNNSLGCVKRAAGQFSENLPADRLLEPFAERTHASKQSAGLRSQAESAHWAV